MPKCEEKMQLALYRKYRPTCLDDVIGQPQVTDILSAAAKNGSFAHAYLFTGQRGTGKTTVARILAHLINGLNYDDNINSGNIDIIEIDAASNNGVDDVREIRDSVQLAPMNCSHKVYIIDEFHMLSKPAFNALLKTIEEPPEYAVFILATTELQKVPATILSRVQRFHFKPLESQLLAKHLGKIAKQEKISVDNDALLLIAKQGGGSVRDSITLLDQLSGHDKITVETVNNVLNLVSEDSIDDIIASTLNCQPNNIINVVNDIVSDGTSPTALAEQLIRALSMRANNKPELYHLINKLLEVEKSALPEAKLLAALVTTATPPLHLAPAPIDVTQPKPAKASITKKPQKASLAQPTVVNEPSPAIKPSPNVEPAKQSATPTNDKLQLSADQKPIENLVWDDIMQQLADQDRPAVSSILNKCDYRYNANNNTLTLFFGQDFHRKRARTKTFQATLLKTFRELYDTEPILEISDDQAPIDSDVAAVLNIVGGEVTKVNGQI